LRRYHAIYNKVSPRVPWNVFDQVCSLGLEVSDFFTAICMLRFFIAICILRRAICVQNAYCGNIDSFLLNQKGLDSMSILPKKFCNMHIAHCNMHIAKESILPLTPTTLFHKDLWFLARFRVPQRFVVFKILVTMRTRAALS